MTDEIRRALEARIPATAGSPRRQARIRARIAELEHKEEPIVKRKLSVAAALMMALMLLGGTALAAGLGLNLFAYFGEWGTNWPELAVRWAAWSDQAVLETQAPVTVAHEVLGAAEAVMTNAYYDGREVTVAYALEEGRKLERWTPTEAQKADLTPELWGVAGTMTFFNAINEEEKAVKEEILAEAAAGHAVGYTVRYIYPGRLTAKGIELLEYRGDSVTQADGTQYEIRAYIVPVRDEVRDQDALELRMALIQTAGFYWFDGSDWFERVEQPREVSALTATVRRSAADGWRERYTGEAQTAAGMRIGVEACVSDGMIEITMTADEPGFPYELETTRYPDRITERFVWQWEIAGLCDEQGRALQDEETALGYECFMDNNIEMMLGYRRSYAYDGDLPETILLELDGLDGEGTSMNVLLTPVE